jgi:tripartite-type tricarboxylate transporter receptor subunit TctC
MRRLLLTLAVIAAAGLPAKAADDFYKGKTIKLIVGAGTGAGYDAYARLMARHMPKYIPGQPTIVVMNMPGAEGMIAGNHMFNVADRDGTVFGAFNNYMVVRPLLGNNAAKYKPEAFNWLGTTASNTDNSYLLVIRSALPHRTVEDLRNAKLPLFIATVSSDVPQVLKEALGLSYRIMTGYKSKHDVELAINRGEVDGDTLSWTSLLSRNTEWVRTGFVRPMIQFGRVDRLPALKDVPTARELARTPQDRALVEFAELPQLMARPYAAPPGVPADRVAILRKAFIQANNDPAYIAEAKKMQLELTPQGGEAVQELVAGLAKASPDVINRYKDAVAIRGPSGGG